MDLTCCHATNCCNITYQGEASDQWTQQDQQLVTDLLFFLYNNVKHIQKTERSQTETQELQQRPKRQCQSTETQGETTETKIRSHRSGSEQKYTPGFMYDLIWRCDTCEPPELR